MYMDMYVYMHMYRYIDLYICIQNRSDWLPHSCGSLGGGGGQEGRGGGGGGALPVMHNAQSMFAPSSQCVYELRRSSSALHRQHCSGCTETARTLHSLAPALRAAFRNARGVRVGCMLRVVRLTVARRIYCIYCTSHVARRIYCIYCTSHVACRYLVRTLAKQARANARTHTLPSIALGRLKQVCKALASLSYYTLPCASPVASVPTKRLEASLTTSTVRRKL